MKVRSANIYVNDVFAGKLMEDTSGFTFTYDRRYLDWPGAYPISASLPFRERPYTRKILFPFFKGLIPEGWLFELNARALKIDSNDEFGMLLHTGRDCIGAVTVVNSKDCA